MFDIYRQRLLRDDPSKDTYNLREFYSHVRFTPRSQSRVNHLKPRRVCLLGFIGMLKIERKSGL